MVIMNTWIWQLDLFLDDSDVQLVHATLEL